MSENEQAIQQATESLAKAALFLQKRAADKSTTIRKAREYSRLAQKAAALKGEVEQVEKAA